MEWTVGPVQDTQHGNLSGKSFSINNRYGAPVVTFVYRTDEEAEEARDLVDQALQNVIFVAGMS